MFLVFSEVKFSLNNKRTCSCNLAQTPEEPHARARVEHVGHASRFLWAKNVTWLNIARAPHVSVHQNCQQWYRCRKNETLRVCPVVQCVWLYRLSASFVGNFLIIFPGAGKAGDSGRRHVYFSRSSVRLNCHDTHFNGHVFRLVSRNIDLRKTKRLERMMSFKEFRNILRSSSTSGCRTCETC